MMIDNANHSSQSCTKSRLSFLGNILLNHAAKSRPAVAVVTCSVVYNSTPCFDDRIMTQNFALLPTQLKEAGGCAIASIHLGS